MKITIRNFMKIITHDFTVHLFAGAPREGPKALLSYDVSKTPETLGPI
jgi:hypothetical protein